MVRQWKIVIACIIMAAVMSMPLAAASIVTEALRGAAVGYAVKQSAGSLDSFINKITLQKGLSSRLDTKVVPILSVGEKGYVGAAQVSGPKNLVNKVEAVFQYEKDFDRGRYRLKVLVPSSSLNPLQLKRVDKVGVSAVIDVALAGGLKRQYYSGDVGGGEILRAAAVAVGVKSAASSIDKAINAISFNKDARTRVVPMASIGEKAYIGGAQIAASSRVVNDVEAVWQYEDLFSNGKFRVKILVPTSSVNPLKLKRVEGVGVTAIVDTSIADQQEPGRRIYRDGRIIIVPDRDSKDNGKHKGWIIGEHKGWDKDKDKERDD